MCIQEQKDISDAHGIQLLLDNWESSGVSGAEASTTEMKTEMLSSNHSKLHTLLDLLTDKEIQPMLFIAERLLKGRSQYGKMHEWPGGPALILDAAEEAADLFQYLLWYLHRLQDETENEMELAGRG